jgi:hypothetical protein
MENVQKIDHIIYNSYGIVYVTCSEVRPVAKRLSTALQRREGEGSVMAQSCVLCKRKTWASYSSFLAVTVGTPKLDVFLNEL